MQLTRPRTSAHPVRVHRSIGTPTYLNAVAHARLSRTSVFVCVNRQVRSRASRSVYPQKYKFTFIMGRRSLSTGTRKMVSETISNVQLDNCNQMLVSSQCVSCNKTIEVSPDTIDNNYSLRFCDACMLNAPVKCIRSLMHNYETRIFRSEELANEKFATLEKMIDDLKSQLLSSTTPILRPKKRQKLSPTEKTEKLPGEHSSYGTDVEGTIASTERVGSLKTPKSYAQSVQSLPGSSNLKNSCMGASNDLASEANQLVLGMCSKPVKINEKAVKSTKINECAPLTVKMVSVDTEKVTIRNPAPLTSSSRSMYPKSLTVICTNVPESINQSLKGRQDEERHRWAEICELIELKINPVSLVRLSRKPSSLHSSEPRLLRVGLSSEQELEDVLLSCHLLGKSSTNMRIILDRPWSERQKHKLDHEGAKIEESKRSLLVYGVPEPENGTETVNRKNDCVEWKFLQELYEVRNVLTTSIIRLPTSLKYLGSGPRIMKVNFASSHMATEAITCWKRNRKRGPSELRFKPMMATTTPNSTAASQADISHSNHPSNALHSTAPLTKNSQ